MEAKESSTLSPSLEVHPSSDGLGTTSEPVSSDVSPRSVLAAKTAATAAAAAHFTTSSTASSTARAPVLCAQPPAESAEPSSDSPESAYNAPYQMGHGNLGFPPTYIACIVQDPCTTTDVSSSLGLVTTSSSGPGPCVPEATPCYGTVPVSGPICGPALGSSSGSPPGPSSGSPPGPSSGSAPGPSSGSAPGPSSGSPPGPSSGSAPWPTSDSAPGPSSGSAPGLSSGSAPGLSSGSAPGLSSGSAPGLSSGSAPGLSSGSAPGLSSGSAPGLSSGSAPGLSSGSAPGLSSGSAPGPSSSSAPGPSSGSAPGPSSGSAPGPSSGSAPESGSGPGLTPGADAEPGPAPEPGSCPSEKLIHLEVDIPPMCTTWVQQYYERPQKQPLWESLQVSEPGVRGPQDPRHVKGKSTLLHKTLPRGRCLLYNWEEERATDHLDQVPCSQDGSESFFFRHGHQGLLTMHLQSPMSSSTTQRDSYQPPGEPCQPLRGNRAAMLEMYLYHQICNELEAEQEPKRKLFEVESVTRHDYGVKLVPARPPAPTKAHDYCKEQPETFWLQMASKIPGVSNIRTVDTPFWKNCSFSTPLPLCLGDPLPCEPESYPQKLGTVSSLACQGSELECQNRKTTPP
ncbi:sperm-associated antigen 8 [Dipodomys spectabilis]|uniref:sperm-associated antigen 8 n=1 Tax=Dipodomys spectabilis TaxID=105255 RepID=UPI001C546C93|nr:sperm-associated antigen 8 [Dipodomys spectabilis]